MAKLFEKEGIISRNSVLAVVFTIVSLILMIVVFFSIGNFRSKNNLIMDVPSTTGRANYRSASPNTYKEAAADASVVRQEPIGAGQKEGTTLLDAPEKAKEQASKSMEIERTKEADTISPEYLRIGMILDPDTDIPGARYATVTDRLGRTLHIPTNLPDGYSACSLGWESGSVVMIVPADGNYMAMQVSYNKDGVSEFAPPELAWELYQEDKLLRERLESLPQGSEEWHKAKTDRDRFIERYGSVETHIVKSGSGYPIIVYGPDGEGGYRSIVNP